MYFKISNCGFRLELNASCNNVKIVTTGALAFVGKICKYLSIFLQTAFHQSVKFCALLQDAFSSNPKPEFEILKNIFF